MENSDAFNPVVHPKVNDIAEPTPSQPQHQFDASTINGSMGIENDFQSFDPRNISAERMSGGIFAGIVGIAAIVGVVILFLGVGWGWIFISTLAAAIFCYAILFYFTIFWPAVEHRHRHWRLTDVGLEVCHGVWWKHMQAIPWARVQHADVSQGPIQRMYGVGTLTVHTAGTSNSSVNLAGLSHETAIQLRDEIIRQRASGDVV